MKINFAENIRKLRRAKGLTQDKLGECCGYSNDAVLCWENKKSRPKYETVCFLADFFEVTVDDLLRGEL